jgi:hypothetical protein
MYKLIGDQIFAIMQTLINNFSGFYNYEPKELKDYPAVTVSALGHTNDPYDTAGNKREYSFMVRCYTRTDDSSFGEDSMRQCLDSVITALEGNISLNSTCDFNKATKGRVFYQEREIPVRVGEVTIVAVKRVNR